MESKNQDLLASLSDGNPSQRVYKNINRIIDHWLALVTQQILVAQDQPPEKITNGLHDFLNALSEVLSSEKPAVDIDCSSYKNLAHARLYGVTRAEIPGYTLDQVIIEFRILRTILFEVLEEGSMLTKRDRDIILGFFDNGMIAASTEFALLRGFSDARLALATESAKKVADAELVDANVEIERLSAEQKSRENFVSALSHDLRNPLTAAKMCSELISRDSGNSELTKKYSARITEAIERTDRMIRDLLDSNRISGGLSVPIHKEDCDLTALLQKTIKDLNIVFGKRVTLYSPETLYASVDADGLRRVVENLVTNAVKYGSRNSAITLTVAEDQSEVQLNVHNEGNAISKSDQETLFQQFRRTESAQSGSESGWGIGLTVVKGIAEAHGGRVTVQSSPKEGTTFTVFFPKTLRGLRTAPVRILNKHESHAQNNLY